MVAVVGQGFDVTRIAPKLYIGSFNPNTPALCAAGFGQVVRVAMELRPCDFPLDDAQLTEPQRRTAEAAARAIHNSLTKGERVLVQCAAGLNRSAYVAALAAIYTYNTSPVGLVQQIQATRRSPRAPTVGALSNASFVADLLRRY